MIVLSSVSIEALCYRSSHHSDDSSSHHLLMIVVCPELWWLGPWGGTKHQGHSKEVQKSLRKTPVSLGHRRQSHSRLQYRHRLWTTGIRPWDQSSQWRRGKLWNRICKDGATSRQDIASEDNQLQGCRKDWVGTSGTRTWDYGSIAPGYVLAAQIQFWSSQIACQSAGTRHFREA